ncbi:MAG: 4-phosphoerythronate dehydrogenase [Natronospirillum sp.]|uniref:4-phosphoerythronate dehydrogenase n=1 Tax=Natronospirillum sp. TaxID=2812955 RepID=UPI0025DE9F31|nr:4-phosphoerythronate dehydrogenase [Natronospirillum sp.]MCH8550824.1 4-phosphoerythronate dehydrogenase [Natronospirillum sp.]
MRILADENMPAVAALFDDVATEIRTCPGRTMTPAALADVDVLLVRSVTRVDADLLSRADHLRFVGSATIGTDHVDRACLADRSIPFAWAPGCNALGVVDFVLGALLLQFPDDPAALRKKRVAVVGAGNVGGRLVSRLRALGLQVDVCDPPREATGEPGPDGAPESRFVSLQEAFTADIVCCHAPLTVSGGWPTQGMVTADLMMQMPEHAIVLNAGRGGVIASDVLRETLRRRPDLQLLLDVWDPEPDLPLDIMAHTRMATGHIAGYSLEGRVRGTWMLRRAVAEELGLAPPVQSVTDLLPRAPTISLNAAELPDDAWQVLREAVLRVCDPVGDDQRFREAIGAVSAKDRGSAFDAYRRDYAGRAAPRRELGSTVIEHQGLGDEALRLLRTAGFIVR